MRAVHAVPVAHALRALLQVDGGKCAALTQCSARAAVRNVTVVVGLVELGFAAVIGRVAVAVAVACVAVRDANAGVAARLAVSGGANVATLSAVERIARQVEVARLVVAAVPEPCVARRDAALAGHAHRRAAIGGATAPALAAIQGVAVQAGFTAVAGAKVAVSEAGGAGRFALSALGNVVRHANVGAVLVAAGHTARAAVLVGYQGSFAAVLRELIAVALAGSARRAGLGCARASSGNRAAIGRTAPFASAASDARRAGVEIQGYRLVFRERAARFGAQAEEQAQERQRPAGARQLRRATGQTISIAALRRWACGEREALKWESSARGAIGGNALALSASG